MLIRCVDLISTCLSFAFNTLLTNPIFIDFCFAVLIGLLGFFVRWLFILARD